MLALSVPSTEIEKVCELAGCSNAAAALGLPTPTRMAS